MQVAIVVPIAQVVEPKVLQSMMKLTAYSQKHGVDIANVGITERQLIDDARNMLAETFLKTPAEWIFWMDSDMTFDEDALVKLLETAKKKDAKMVTGIYYQRKGMNYPCLWSRGEELQNGDVTGVLTKKGQSNKYMGTFVFPHPDKKEPFEVHAAGFGCVLLHRSVLEVMPRPWFQFIKGVCSEDFYFFVNAHEYGFKLWADPTITLGHIGDAPVVTKQDFYKKATTNQIEIEALK